MISEYFRVIRQYLTSDLVFFLYEYQARELMKGGDAYEWGQVDHTGGLVYSYRDGGCDEDEEYDSSVHNDLYDRRSLLRGS